MKFLGTMFVVVLALAGCLDGKPAPNPMATSTASPGPSSTSSPPLEGNVTVEPEVPVKEVLLSGCLAIQAFSNYPAVIAPGERPEGWGPDSPDNIAAVSILAYQCNRIAVAGYERGPFHLLLDFHGNAAIPPDCAADTDGFTRFRILRHLVVDDAEIGAYLQSSFGVPVLLAAFGLGERDVGAGSFHDLRWSIDGAAASVVTIFDPAVKGRWPIENDRLFWQIGDGLGVLDLKTSESNAPTTQLPANGTIQPPMLLARDTNGAFVGGGALFDDVSAHARFSRYADLECKEPMA